MWNLSRLPFSRGKITALLTDGGFRTLQVALASDPEKGALIQGSGGLRKIRWAAGGKGKSGGIRVIYYLLDQGRLYLLFAYPKSKQDNLTKDQLKTLRSVVAEELK